MIRLLWHQRGAAAIEFGLALPPFLILLMGALQLGIVAMARTGLQHAVDEGARYATIFPTPTDAQIIAYVKNKRVGLDPAYATEPVVTHGTQYGIAYTEITMSYARPLNFLVYQTAPVSVSYTRRAY